MSAPVSARIALAFALVATSAAHATNGYLPHGYGVQAKGAGGVAAALPQDALVIATNPAGLVAVGSRIDAGAEYFRPVRESSIEGNLAGADADYPANGTSSFLIPEFAWNHLLLENVAVGVAVYGNGGMNTDYSSNPYARFASTGETYMNLEQLFVSPALAVRLGDVSTVGIALNLAFQRFEMRGIDGFTPFSADPAAVTDNGADTSGGYGVRIGWLGEVNDAITLGASYQTKTKMSEFDKYAGLFADGGDFDIPANAVVGIAVKASDSVTIGIDWQTIKYGDIGAVGNRVDPLWSGALLGSDHGPGFGWDDMRVLKVGAVYRANDRLTLRAGFSHGDQPIPQDQTFFNIIAPGVVQDHLTLGGTLAIGETSALSVAYAHAFAHDVEGEGSIPAFMGGGEANLRMYEDMIAVAWSRRL